jgi:hypothetical protein
MEATIRSHRAAFARLRGEVVAMAKAVADAKAALQAAGIKPDAAADGKAVEIGALLHAFEGRLNAMLFLADFVCDGGADAPGRELDHVPTVSDVVSRLGRESADDDRSGTAAGSGSNEAPSVSMLGALVEALNASMSATEPSAGTEPVVDATSAAVATVEPDRGEASFEEAQPAAAGADPPAQAAAVFATTPDGRDIGERSDAVLRTAMPGHDDV